MGSVSILLRAPFVALAHAAGLGEPWQYQIGAVACLVPAAAVGVALAGRFRTGRQSSWVGGLVAALAVANPATVAAVAEGHPEEVLGSALAVGAVLLAVRQRTAAAALALGLALATKQWAVIAVVPVILAVPRSQRRLLLAAGAIVAALTLPAIAADLTGFIQLNQQAAATPLTIGHTNVWFLLAHPHTLHIHAPAGFSSEFVVYRIPAWVARWSHPMIVVAALPFAALFARRRSGGSAVAVDALALLALAFLLRCVLDPVDNAYYHAPMLLALLAWEVFARGRRFPIVSVLTSAALWVTFERVEPAARPAVANAFYLSWTTLLMIYLVYVLWLLPQFADVSIGPRLRRLSASVFARP